LHEYRAKGFPFQVLLDYGHNPDGVRELCEVVSKQPVGGKQRLLSLKFGNRHWSHLELIAPVFAHTFNTFTL
jgi:cyanophycin synthetase